MPACLKDLDVTKLLPKFLGLGELERAANHQLKIMPLFLFSGEIGHFGKLVKFLFIWDLIHPLIQPSLIIDSIRRFNPL